MRFWSATAVNRSPGNFRDGGATVITRKGGRADAFARYVNEVGVRGVTYAVTWHTDKDATVRSAGLWTVRRL